jgi:hypothetical protein
MKMSGATCRSRKSFITGLTSRGTWDGKGPSGNPFSGVGGKVASLRRSRLTLLQIDLLKAFFEREQRYVLTGGAALAGFYFGHRDTEDLDFFGAPDLNLQDGVRTLEAAAASTGARLESLQISPDFRRLLATRGQEKCVVDLVIDRAPALEIEKQIFGEVRVDTLREIAANKICTLLGRAQLKDLIDLKHLLASGADLASMIADASRKDAGVDPATLAWVLGQTTISADARLPGDADPVDLDAFRRELIRSLQLLAFERARKS